MEEAVYEVQFNNISLDGYEFNALLAQGKVRTANIFQAVSRLKLKAFLENKGVQFNRVVGTILNIDDESATVGHEGSDCGNIKEIKQFNISWKRVSE